MRLILLFLVCHICLSATTALVAGESYRTDGGDEKLRWFELSPGLFPPADAAHVDWVTMIRYDPNRRTGAYRTTAQVGDAYAKITPFRLLPYAQIMMYGALADLRDIPPRTHLRLRTFKNYGNGENDFHPDDFGQIAACSDDFSISVSEGWTWHVDEVKNGRISVTRQGSTVKADAKNRVEFLIDARTTIWKGRGVAELKDLVVGQSVLINQIPGNVQLPVTHCAADIWLDDESRTLATKRQRDHYQFELKQRGLPGYVTAVDNKTAIITVTFFDCGDPTLFKDLQVGKRAHIAVGFDNLMTCEPAGGQGGPDAMQSDVVSVTAVPAISGSSGVQVVLKPRFLLEGFRPTRVVRVCPEGSGFQFVVVPPEERVTPGLWESRNERVKPE